MRRAVMVVLAVLLPLLLWPAQIPEDLVKSFTLKNGMRFMVVERHEAPTVSCVIIYDVGSADEPVGKTGMAHLLEHLMFKGSQRFGTSDWEKEKPIFDEANRETHTWIAAADESARKNPPGVFKEEQVLVPTDELKAAEAKMKEVLDEERKYIIKNEFWGTYDRHGGEFQNAFTSPDLTTYFVVLPANKLDLWAILETERMTKAVFREFYSERDVIMEEKRLSDESDPGSVLYETLSATVFPTHPYGRPVVGYWDDLRHMTHEDVAAFYRNYYKPNNAVAIVAGDVTAERVKALAEKYFEPIPRGEIPRRLWTDEPPLAGGRQATVVFDAKPQAAWAYRAPGQMHPDYPALQLAAQILGSGTTSRLNLRLVLKDKIASSVYSYCAAGRDPEVFQIGCIPFEGHSVDEVEKVIREEVARLAETGPEAKELEKVKNKAHANTVYRLESPIWLANWLGNSEILWGDWREGYKYLDRIDAVTATDISRVLKKYLVPTNEVKVTLQPKEKKP